MAYYTDLFTVETYEAYLKSDMSVSGFRETQHAMAKRIQKGDKLLAYVKGLSRWAALLEVIEGPFIDNTPVFLPESDPFVVRFRVRPVVYLDLEHALPIQDPMIFDRLSFTKGRAESYWLGPLRRSLQHIAEDDGEFLESTLRSQAERRRLFPIDGDVLEDLRPRQVKPAW